MKTQADVLIDRSLDEVFENTVRHVPAWSDVVLEEQVLEDVDDGGVGTRFRSICQSQGKRIEFEGEVTHHQPPFHHAAHLKGAMFDIEVAYSFEAAGGGTRVTQISDVHGKGGFGVFLRLFGWLMRKSSRESAQQEMQHLKSFCERREPERS